MAPEEYPVAYLSGKLTLVEINDIVEWDCLVIKWDLEDLWYCAETPLPANSRQCFLNRDVQGIKLHFSTSWGIMCLSRGLNRAMCVKSCMQAVKEHIWQSVVSQARGLNSLFLFINITPAREPLLFVFAAILMDKHWQKSLWPLDYLSVSSEVQNLLMSTVDSEAHCSVPSNQTGKLRTKVSSTSKKVTADQ